MNELVNQNTTWEMTTLGELCSNNDSLLQTGPFGSQLHARDYTEVSGIPVIMPANIGHRTIDSVEIKKIKETDARRLKKYRVEEGDIVYARRGNIGSHAFIKTDQRGWLCGTGCLLARVKNDRILPEYISFYLLQKNVTNWILRHAVGTTMANLNTTILSKLPVIIPPLSEQKTIASILGALDDKIEHNNKMNETLETMARALYKSWFVDFDPVVAKAAGKRPFGMDDETAALFPDKFVDSELGPIPEGWEVKPISSIMNILSGGTPKTKEPSYWGGNIPWFSVVDTPSPRNVFVIDTQKHITKAGVDSSAAKIFRAETVIITARGTVGNVVMSATPMAFNQSCYGIHGKTGYDDFFIFFTVKELVEELQRIAHGSVFDTITRKTFDSVKMPIPTPQIAKHYNKKISPWLDLIKSNLFEMKTLSKLRDLLLPKLISGEIRIKDAEKVVEEVL